MLEIILILTNVVPPELPMELTIAVNASLQSLMRIGIFCLEPFRIPIAGKVDVCCFDKTGTLTESTLTVARIVTSGDILPEIVRGNDSSAASNSFFAKLENPKSTQIDRVAQVIGVCHSLIKIRNTISGDSLEASAFRFEKMELLDDNTARHDNNILKTIKRYSFSSSLRRMTCVGEFNSKRFVAMKGAPEVVRHYLKSIPESYSEYEVFARSGFRVLALAYKDLNSKIFIRDEVEKELTFVGFILYECKLKPDALATVKELTSSRHKVVMITGDNLLTAQCVASKLGISGEGVEGEGIDLLLKEDCEASSSCMKNNSNSVPMWKSSASGVRGNDATSRFGQVSVFARADPKQKEMIIERYKTKGFITLMCGDGTNDVGALKAAHVGVAIVDGNFRASVNKLEDIKIKMGDASVAAPFTVKTGDLCSVLDIIRQGRSALVTTIQMYKILALNSLITAFSLSVLDAMGVRFSDMQMTVSGILLAFSFMFLTTSKSRRKISKNKPLANIFNFYTIVSILLQTLVHIFTYYLVIGVVHAKETTTYSEKFSPSLMNSVLFLVASQQQVSTFIVNYIGKPFRESMVENRPLAICMTGLCIFIGMLVFQTNEDFVKTMEIVFFDREMKLKICKIIGANFFTCLAVEKLCFYMFMLY